MNPKTQLTSAGLTPEVAAAFTAANYEPSHLLALAQCYGATVFRSIADALADPISATSVPSILAAWKQAADNNACLLVASLLKRQQAIPAAAQMPQRQMTK